ncbi:MAG: hypothetical protein U0401_26000 [Anaerolineae bacterium]
MPEVLIATLEQSTSRNAVTVKDKRLGCEISHILIINTSSQDEKILGPWRGWMKRRSMMPALSLSAGAAAKSAGPIPDITTEAGN